MGAVPRRSPSQAQRAPQRDAELLAPGAAAERRGRPAGLTGFRPAAALASARGCESCGEGCCGEAWALRREAGPQRGGRGPGRVARAVEVSQGGAATLLRLSVSQVSAPKQQGGQSGRRARGRRSEPRPLPPPPPPPPPSGSLKGQPGLSRRCLLDLLCPGSSQQLPTDPRSEGGVPGVLARDQRMGFREAASPAHMGLHSRPRPRGGQYRPLAPLSGQARLRLQTGAPVSADSRGAKLGLGCATLRDRPSPPCAPRARYSDGQHAS